jgi:hypothetical protein
MMSEHPDPNDLANEAAESIARDVAERSGLGKAWERVDEDTQNEIKSGWAGIIHLRLVELDKSYRPQDQPPSDAELILLSNAFANHSWYVGPDNFRAAQLLVDRAFAELDEDDEGLLIRPTEAGKAFVQRIEAGGAEA